MAWCMIKQRKCIVPTLARRCLCMKAKTKELAQGVLRGNRLSLSRAITLVESVLEAHRVEAERLLDYVVRERFKGSIASRHCRQTCLRIGIAGPPGAGKSTFIEALGKYLIHDRGMRVAVMAVDPSSSRSGGSILGDKTRMLELSKHPRAFVRACPTAGVLGGVARYTNECVLLCQSAGFDVVFVETVGLGQSEIIIDETSDILVLLVPPGGGDELQGVKKGIIELADVVVVNKADGHLLTAAQHTAADYTHALQFQRRKCEQWAPTVTMCSALRTEKIADVWSQVEKCRDALNECGFLREKRRKQGQYWLWNSLEDQLIHRARNSRQVQQTALKMEEMLLDGAITPRSAAEALIDVFVEDEGRPTQV